MPQSVTHNYASAALDVLSLRLQRSFSPDHTPTAVTLTSHTVSPWQSYKISESITSCAVRCSHELCHSFKEEFSAKFFQLMDTVILKLHDFSESTQRLQNRSRGERPITRAHSNPPSYVTLSAGQFLLESTPPATGESKTVQLISGTVFPRAFIGYPCYPRLLQNFV